MPLTTVEAKAAAACAERFTEYGSAITVAWPGLDFPGAGQSFPNQFIDFNVVPVPATWITRTSKRHDSLLIMRLSTRLPYPAIQATETAGLIAAHFNVQPVFTLQGVTITLIQPAAVQGAIYDGAWMYHPIQAQITAIDGV